MDYDFVRNLSLSEVNNANNIAPGGLDQYLYSI